MLDVHLYLSQDPTVLKPSVVRTYICIFYFIYVLVFVASGLATPPKQSQTDNLSLVPIIVMTDTFHSHLRINLALIGKPNLSLIHHWMRQRLRWQSPLLSHHTVGHHGEEKRPTGGGGGQPPSYLTLWYMSPWGNPQLKETQWAACESKPNGKTQET